jgi:hypothetical protein
MDAEGARALARRIAQGPPKPEAARSNGNAASRPRAIFGMHVYRTVKTPLVLEGRPAVLRQRIRSTLVGDGWTSIVIEETLQYRD